MQTIKICNVIPGMMNAEIIGIIGKIITKEYSGKKGSGKLCSLMLTDETGSVRVVLWNDEISRVEGAKEGDALRVRGFVKQGMFGPEIMLGKEGFAEVTERGPDKIRIADLREGHKPDVRAALVWLFESSPFYDICPKCGVSLKGGEYKCVAHGEVQPGYALRVSGVIDDGTGSMRCVFFKENAERILGADAEKAKDIVLRKGVTELFKNAQLREYIFSGRVRKNAIFDRIEFVVDKINEVDPVKEAKQMLSRFSS
ncbi:MAG: hypothetical protein HYW25_02405 [Candidatus Aenigmarchaeota archaeon]|nr:hypothetical protein [Candidatus Aenigmarchaeota archaeon]